MHVIPAHQGRPSDDPIFALNKEATARKARGESIVNATVGALLHDDGRLAILPTAARAVHEVVGRGVGPVRADRRSPDFLGAVAKDLFKDEPEMLACAAAAATPGGTGALRHAIANYLEPGQSLLTTSFFWGPYQTLCDESDRKLATFTMFDAEGKLDTAALDRSLAEQMKTQKRALLVLNDPCHNPTGYSMTSEEWRAVVERLVARSGEGPITLLCDTAYFAYAARPIRARS